MAGSLNKVMLIGNLGRDPEIRTMQSGSKMATFPLATSETWRDRNTQERREKTEWHRVVVFNEGLVTVIERYVKKGSKLYIEGQLETRKWTDQQGQERFTTEVVLRPFRGELTMLDSARGEGGGGYDRGYSPPADDYGGGSGSGAGSAGGDGYGSGFGTGAGSGSGKGYGGGRAPEPARDELDDEIPF